MNRSMRSMVVLLTFAAMGVPGVVYGDLAAHFSDGNTDTAVDGYMGMAGDGWDTAWVQRTKNHDAENSAIQVLQPGDPEYVELKPGVSGNYLNVRSKGLEGSDDIRYAECRDYKGDDPSYFDPTRPHTVQFSVRINEVLPTGPFDPGFTAYDGDFYMVEDFPYAKDNSSSSMRWAVRVDGGEGKGVPGLEWRFVGGVHDAGSFPEGGGTGIMLETGVVYDFTIEVDPTNEVEGIGLGTWVGTIDNGTTSYTGPVMGWRSTSNEPGGYLNFISNADSVDDVRDWSIDNISITQAYVPPIPGDTDGNRIVDEVDAGVLAQYWGATVTEGASVGDFNGDDTVNMLDASILAANWGDHTGAESAAAVPEPSTLVGLLVLSASLLLWRRR